MIYLKKEISEGIEIKVDVYDDEFYTTCPICTKEFNLDHEHLKSLDFDFAGTTIFCEDCSKHKIAFNNLYEKTMRKHVKHNIDI